MPFLGRTQAEIAKAILDAFPEADRPDADTTRGNVLRDMANVVASQLSAAYTRLENVRKTASLLNYSAISADALSHYAASNFEVLRTDKTYATGTVTFQAVNRPGANIGIPAGTLLWTRARRDGSYLVYTTDEDVTLRAATERNPLTGYYEVDAAVTASEAGTASHVGVGALSIMPNRTAGIDKVTNKEAINNATDQQTNESLAAAVRSFTAGSLLGTAPGYVTAILDGLSLVQEVAVVGPFDDDNLRVQYYNEVDVPIVSSIDGESFTATLTTDGNDTTPFADDRPILTVTSVVGATTGANYTANTQYGFSRDTSAVFGYSARSLDALCWFPNQVPGPGLQLRVQGTKSTVVKQAQDFLDDLSRKYITGDLLVKEAVEVAIDIVLSASALSGVDQTQLTADITAAIVAALDAYALGQDVQEDDIVTLVQNVTGVDAVEIPVLVKKSTDSSYSQVVTIRAQEFARAGTLTITVS